MTGERAAAHEYALRVNRALELLEQSISSADAARQLAARYGVSVRQGWRYVRQAAERSEPLEVPEQKVVFTVKLPESLAERVRAVATSRGNTLSGLVSEALEQMLRRLRDGPQAGGYEDS